MRLVRAKHIACRLGAQPRAVPRLAPGIRVSHKAAAAEGGSRACRRSSLERSAQRLGRHRPQRLHAWLAPAARRAKPGHPGQARSRCAAHSWYRAVESSTASAYGCAMPVRYRKSADWRYGYGITPAGGGEGGRRNGPTAQLRSRWRPRRGCRQQAAAAQHAPLAGLHRSEPSCASAQPGRAPEARPPAMYTSGAAGSTATAPGGSRAASAARRRANSAAATPGCSSPGASSSGCEAGVGWPAAASARAAEAVPAPRRCAARRATDDAMPVGGSRLAPLLLRLLR